MSSKVRALIAVPDSIVLIAKELVRLFDDSSPLLTTESDDLVQTDDAYAGRIGDDLFSIRYFPELEVSEQFAQPKWDFDFGIEELRQIADGRTRTCPIWSCETGCGMKSTDPGFECFNCD